MNTPESTHEKIVALTDTVAKTTRIAAVLTIAGASIAAPTGLGAVGISLGLVSAPLIVTAAPVIAAIAGGTAAVAAAVSLYSKYKRKK